VSDLREPVYRRVMAALARCAEAGDHLLALQDSQRAALRGGDFGLLASLAEESAALLARVERTSRLSPGLWTELAASHGPNASALSECLAQVRGRMGAVAAGVQEFTLGLTKARERIRRDLTAMQGGRPGSSCPLPPAALDVTG
jgi:hypothetical protein